MSFTNQVPLHSHEKTCAQDVAYISQVQFLRMANYMLLFHEYRRLLQSKCLSRLPQGKDARLLPFLHKILCIWKFSALELPIYVSKCSARILFLLCQQPIQVQFCGRCSVFSFPNFIFVYFHTAGMRQCFFQTASLNMSPSLCVFEIGFS